MVEFFFVQVFAGYIFVRDQSGLIYSPFHRGPGLFSHIIKRDIACLVRRNSPWLFKSTLLHGPVSSVLVQLFPNDQSKSSLELCFRHQSVMRQATVKQKDQRTLEVGHVLETHSIPRETCQFLRKLKCCPPKCRMKFS